MIKRLSPSLVVMLAGLFATPAAAQVRLQSDSGGNFALHVMSWRDIPFRTVVRQRYDFSCGSAALSTLLTYHYGRPLDERQSFAAMWATGDQATIRKQGFSLLDMKTYLATIGYRAEGFRLTLDQLAQVKRPMIVLLNLRGYKHFVVLKGMQGGRILVGDPMLGLNSYPRAEFQRYWNGIVLAIMETPTPVWPTYNLASDWGPWSRAPLARGDSTRAAVADLTGNLPPMYQLTPEMLIAAHVGTVN